jgi:hypothetical protein
MNAKVRRPRKNESEGRQNSAKRVDVTRRLDESIPLNTEEWHKVEQMLMRLTEFAPNELVLDLASAIAFYADDQARRGYMLGESDSKTLVA